DEDDGQALLLEFRAEYLTSGWNSRIKTLEKSTKSTHRYH
ncbi:MAG: hypothetical protein ACI9Y1_002238, partial [Lentisphaeria bacterium]